MILFPPNRHNAPAKAFRGKKRYFRGVHQKAAAFPFHPQADDWWDHWHYHADWPGWGNLKWSYRREHLKALCQVYLKITAAMDDYPGDFQCWFFLERNDAGQDAVFVHSANENDTPFPTSYDNVVWGVPELEAHLCQELGGLDVRAGQLAGKNDLCDGRAEYVLYFAYVRGIGTPLE